MQRVYAKESVVIKNRRGRARCMRKGKIKCMQIYNESKDMLYWHLKRRCTWLSDEDIHDVMIVTWEQLAENVDEVYRLKDRASRVAWVLTVADKQAEKLKGKEDE